MSLKRSKLVLNFNYLYVWLFFGFEKIQTAKIVMLEPALLFHSFTTEVNLGLFH